MHIEKFSPTPAGTSVFTKHNWNMGMGYLCLIMGGAFRVWLWVCYTGKKCVFPPTEKSKETMLIRLSSRRVSVQEI